MNLCAPIRQTRFTEITPGPALVCACGSAEVFAVAPGDAVDGVAVQAWCAACWPFARKVAA